MAIIATPGGATSNSYGTLAEAITYFSTQHPIPEKWVLSQSFERENALLTAALDLDELDFIGDKATATQAMKWPRVINDTYELIDDIFPFTATEIPTKLKYAQFEWALYYLTPGSGTAGAIDSLSIGSSVQVKYAAGASTTGAELDPFGVPIKAARHLRGLRLIPVLA